MKKNRRLQCVTSLSILSLLPQAEAICSAATSGPAKTHLAEQIKKEVAEKRFTQDELIQALAESSILSFTLFEVVKEKIVWPKIEN